MQRSKVQYRITLMLLTAALTACGTGPGSESTEPDSSKRVNAPVSVVTPQGPQAVLREEAKVLAVDEAGGRALPQAAPSLLKRQSGYARAEMDLVSIRQANAPVERDSYAEIIDTPVRSVQEHPVSTFSVDVDTGAYSLVRRALN